MIFLTLGSQKFQFNRLLEEIDKLIQKNHIKDEVYAQIGYSDYKPKYYNYTDFTDRSEFDNLEEKCDLLITHGGTGAIIGAVKKGKKVIAVPRSVKYDEHVDDHQFQIVKQFDDLGFIIPCYDVDKLSDAIDDSKEFKVKKYESNTDNIIKSLDEYISSLLK